MNRHNKQNICTVLRAISEFLKRKILILSDIRTDKRASFVSPSNFCYFY